MTHGLKDRHREAIIAEIAANDRVKRAVLFGSRATGTNTVSSDVDIALFGDRLTLTDQARLAAALDEIPMAQSVDLLLHDSIQDRTLREHIRREGVEWYARSRDTWAASPARHRSPQQGVRSSPDEEMPKEWSTVRLGDAADLLTGFPFRSDSYVSDSAAPRLLRGDNVAQGHLRWDGAKRWPAEAAALMANFWLREGDVVLAMDRPWIEAGLKFSSVQRTDVPALLVQRVARLRGGKDLDTRFLKHVIGCRDFSDYVLSIQTGTAVPHISAQQIEDYEFCLPPLHEQSTIAHILGTLDDKIELNRRMNATLEAMARALFKSWFVDFDPVYAKIEGLDTGLPKHIGDLFPSKMVDSKLGKIPEGWEITPFSECVDVVRGLSYKGIHLSSDGVPMHNLNSICEGGGYKQDGLKGYDGEHNSQHVARAGDLIVANTEQGHDRLLIGYAAIVPTSFVNETLFSHHIYRVRPKGCIALTSDYLCQLLNTRIMHEIVSGFANGTTVNMLPMDALQTPQIVVPARPVLAAFNDLAEATRRRQEDMIDESRTLAALRDALLPNLISGDLRVRRSPEI